MLLQDRKTASDRWWKQMEVTGRVCSGSMNLGHIQAVKGVADSVNSEKCSWQWPRSSGKLSLFSNTLRWTPSVFLDFSQRLQPLHFLSLPAPCAWLSQAERKVGGIWPWPPPTSASVDQASAAAAFSRPASAYLWGRLTLRAHPRKV